MGLNKEWAFISKIAFMLLIFTGCEKDLEEDNLLTDADGNVYHSVTIGTQVWMVENLKTTHFRNGDPITKIASPEEWKDLETPAYCDYNNNLYNSDIYGRLYNWHVVNDERNIAPEGWHVPTLEDWQTLIEFLGGSEVAGGKLKQTSTSHWASPNTGATNVSGFSAYGAGCRGLNGEYGSELFYGYWWSSDNYNGSSAYLHYMYFDSAGINRAFGSMSQGFSIRCVKD